MADLGRLGLRGASVVLRVLARAATGFQFALEHGDSVFVSAIAVSPWCLHGMGARRKPRTTYFAFI